MTAERVILHLAERSRWHRAQASGAYTPAAFGSEGFVHCSEPQQTESVAKRLFRGRDDLVLLVISEDRLGSEVRRENLEGGDELFPHVYGALELDAVVDVRRLEADADGHLSIPRDLTRATA